MRLDKFLVVRSAFEDASTAAYELVQLPGLCDGSSPTLNQGSAETSDPHTPNRPAISEITKVDDELPSKESNPDIWESYSETELSEGETSLHDAHSVLDSGKQTAREDESKSKAPSRQRSSEWVGHWQPSFAFDFSSEKQTKEDEWQTIEKKKQAKKESRNRLWHEESNFVVSRDRQQRSLSRSPVSAFQSIRSLVRVWRYRYGFRPWHLAYAQSLQDPRPCHRL